MLQAREYDRLSKESTMAMNEAHSEHANLHPAWLSGLRHTAKGASFEAPFQPRERRRALLYSNEFTQQLRREMRRTNRTGSPFSVAIFSTDQRVENGRPVLYDLSKQLESRLRATDILGWYGSDAIGVLLPDTDVGGTRTFADQVVSESGKAGLHVKIRTYPDQAIDVDPFADFVDPDQSLTGAGSRSFSRAEGSKLKRGLDILGAVAASILFSPIMLITAVAIKTTSRGPIIFKQTRLGYGGSPFVFYKFRSMAVDADDGIHRAYTEQFISGRTPGQNEQPGVTPLFKMAADPRVTRVGEFIRKTSIDELPQLLNVLKGEMSLVGPRPPLPYEVEGYQPWHLRRILDVRPGMTGLWQVQGRSTTSFDDMVRLDLYYVDHWSIWLDLKILLKTASAVIKCKGAV
jgi:exopolysaccharide biosynthesis polyprenyl glycosylphosphotransferase